MSQVPEKRLLAYCEPLSVVAGGDVALHMSSEREPAVEVSVVRVTSGVDDRPNGLVEVASAAAGTHPAEHRRLPAGSYAVAAFCPDWPLRAGTEISLHVKATTPKLGRPQALLSRADGDRGLWIGLLGDGRLCVRTGAAGEDAAVVADRPLRASQWYAVTLGLLEGGEVAVALRPAGRWGERPQTARGRAPEPHVGGPVLLAAARDETGEAVDHFNGCLARVRVDLGDGLRHGWEMAGATDGFWLAGIGAGDAELVNAPTRAVPGPAWDGSAHKPADDPGHYDAVHFHDDDLEDARWPADVTIPTAGLDSGVYAARLRAGGEETVVPFFVRAPRAERRPVALLASTATYLAYANARLATGSPLHEVSESDGTPLIDLLTATIAQRPDLGPSLYDLHTDGSPAMIVSRRRPLVDLTTNGAKWSFAADLDIVELLERAAIPYDVVTDEDVHREGTAALDGYRCLITGAHPEYVSTAMWDALVAYLGAGGRLMYLGGNGFYWRVSHPEDRPWLMECRRAETGARYNEADPGSYHHQFGGEYGGTWRRIGRAPQGLVGVGMAGDGWDDGAPYHFTDAARDPRARFIVDGIDLSAPFGAHGTFGAGGGAAGAEIDRADWGLGTPDHALVIAASGPHTDRYYVAPEETAFLHPAVTGDVAPALRADLVFFETPGGGAVFSTGSIAWSASLPTNGFDNDVARMTRNVIDRFADPAPFAEPWR